MSQTVLFIAAIFPEPSSSAAGTRIVQLIKFFRKQKTHVYFASTAEKTAHSFDLEQLGVTTLQIKVNDSSVEEDLANIYPNMVVFDRFFMEEQFGWRIAELFPNALRILDTEDLHFIRKSREYLQKKKVSVEIAKHRELASIFRSDLALIISSYEYEYLVEHFPGIESQLHYLPFLYEVKTKKQLTFEERQDIVFIGNGIHEPNVDAIMYLKTVIWPLIHQKNKQLKLHIYGAYLPAKIMNLHREQDGFLVHGRAEEALEVIEKARILIAPLRFGAGLKGKLMEAMLCGTPSITTSIGREGLVAEDENWPGFICDEPDEMANKLVELYASPERWENSQQKAYIILEQRFDKQKHEESLEKVIQSKFDNLSAFREKNYIGAMLMQQTTAASKFMSKWIEEKNKLIS